MYISGLSTEVSYIGNFVTKAFGVEGEIYSKGSNTLLIKKFKYSGQGPAATFWVGTDGYSPSSNGILLQVELYIAQCVYTESQAFIMKFPTAYHGAPTTKFRLF